MELEQQNGMYYKEILGLRKRLEYLKIENSELKLINEKLSETIKKRELRSRQRAGNKRKLNKD